MNSIDNRFEAGMLQWINDQMGPVISAIDSTEFYPRLAGFLHEIADWNSGVILSYHRDHSPLVLFENLAPQDRKSLYGSYFDGAYLLSPFYLRWLEDNSSSELYRLQEIVPEGFFDSIYYKDYYRGSRLRDEIAYLIPIDQDSSVLLSLGRTEDMEPYAKRELDLLQAVKTIVSSCVTKHATLVMDSSRTRLSRQLSEQLSTFGTGILTDREKRVAHLMLRGHSSKSCARELTISPTTERVHRRNIYAKLDISSQAELFTRFFETLAVEPERSGMKIASR